MKDSVSPAELGRLLSRATGVTVLDVRRREDRVDVKHTVPGATWRDPERIGEWSTELAADDDIVVYCVHGHRVSRNARDYLRERGHRVCILEGGIEAWQSFSEGSSSSE